MQMRLTGVTAACLGVLCLLAAPELSSQAAKPATPAGPVVVVDTVKGVIEFETFPKDAPKSVEHILGLVKKNFYNGLRVHRVVPNGLIQFGDPLTRDMSKQQHWGRGSLGSGKTIGVAEFSKKRPHVRGAVGLAHAGNAAEADSQMYIVMVPRPQYDGSYAVIGQVTTGMDVVAKIEETDRIKRVSIK